MAGVKRRSMAKLCLALGLFILAGVFRQLDRAAPPLPSAVFFLLTNLIYIGLAMAWFSTYLGAHIGMRPKRI